MLKSTSSNQTIKFRLLCKQLNDLNLIYQNGSSKRTTTTRITPRGLQPRKMEIHKIIYWHKSKMFPPNWKTDHHIFYPSLKELLLKKHLQENNLDNYVNLGVDYVKKELKKKPLKRKELKLKKLESKQDLLDLVDLKSSDIKFNYDQYNQQSLRSDEGLRETIGLAQHYELFRDIFLTERLPAKPLKKVDYYDLYPRPEYIEDSEVEKYYPGSIRFNMNERNDYRYFNPVVPVYSEFVNSQDEITTSFRGNLIEPDYSLNKPNIVLDTSYFTNKEPTKLYEELVVDGKAILTDQTDQAYYTVALLNLDNIFLDQKPTCHYMVSNIKGNEQEECIKYLPAYGVKGLGYHRYVFLAFRHDEKLKIDQIDDFDLKKRSFNAYDFIKQNESINLKPVGLNWFQSRWNEGCKEFFHNVLKTRMPVYEYIQNKEIKNKQVKIPAPASFNNYLDRYRDPKEIEKEVLLERLSTLNPFDYETALEERELPPNIYKIPQDTPSWIKGQIWKRRNQFGRFRGLRPPSALKPLNNNEDLDCPKWPHPDKVDLPMRYPFIFKQVKPLKDSKWAVPPEQRPSLVEDPYYDVPNQNKEEGDKIYNDFKNNK